jgi:hypothetical protein
MPEDGPALAVPATCTRYDYKGRQELAARLEAERIYRPDPLRSPEDLLLDPAGRVQHKYRLTTLALSQLCQLLSPGLSTLLSDIADSRHNASAATSQEVAIRILNAVVRLRYNDRLAGKSLVIDRHNERADSFAAELQPVAAPFYEASVIGRRLTVRYLSPQAVFDLGGDAFFLGWQFANSETGNCAVHVGYLLVRALGRTCSLRETYSIRHRYPVEHLEMRVRQARAELEACARQELPKLHKCAVESQQKLLGLSGSSHSTHGRFRRFMFRIRNGKKLPLRVAERALQRTITHGSSTSSAEALAALENTPLANPEEIARSRTVYDLYNSLTYVARELTPPIEEATELLAHRLLTGRFRLN